MKKVNTEEIIVNKEEREALIERVDVLKKVKDLLLLPNMEMATTQQVADFYAVDFKAIVAIYLRHKEELEQDGMQTLTGKEVREKLVTDTLQVTKVTNKKGHVLVETPNGSAKIAYRSNKLFPKRAILRVGMLLRDSEVAKGVRSQLLNIEEKAHATNPGIVTADIDREMMLEAKLCRAMESKNSTAIVAATRELDAYRNRHIEQAAKHYESLADLVDTMTITELCRHNLKGRITPQKANKILLDLGIYESVKVRGSWIPAPKYKGTWFRLAQQSLRFSAGEVTAYRITLEGAEEITKLLKQHLMEESQAA
ncbi:phage antirepressor KilAC domain-containing protein [Bacillus paranthracis]|uniref:phage antirepressor KilAC domain-containing protein n=1 Tax=Bacillus paranthracis TaxID=2026186 RepID=UPI0020B72998|nr:phage antirepressor KilAC domain-containing protein [Bacillus paranthracis]